MHSSKLAWLSCLILSLFHLTANCLGIPLHPSYHPEDLPYSLGDTKSLFRAIDCFTSAYALSMENRFENPEAQSKLYKDARIRALKAFHPGAEIHYEWPRARPVSSGVQISKHTTEYVAAYNTKYIELVIIHHVKNGQADTAAIQTMKRKMKEEDTLQNYLKGLREPALSETDVPKSGPYHYDFMAMKSYHPGRIFPWPTRTIVKVLALGWLQKNGKTRLDMQKFVHHLSTKAFPGSTIVKIVPPMRTGTIRILQLFRQHIGTTMEREPLFSYTLEGGTGSAPGSVRTFVLPGSGITCHLYIFLHALEIGASYDTATLHSSIAAIKIPKEVFLAKMEHKGLLARIHIPFCPKNPVGFDSMVSEYIDKIRIKFEVAPRIMQRKIVRAVRTFDEMVTLIFEYVTNVPVLEDIMAIYPKDDCALLEPFDKGIIYTVGDRLYKQEFGMHEPVPLKHKIGKPVSLSVSADGNIIVVICEGNQAFILNRGQVERQPASCGLVSSDGTRIILEHPKEIFDEVPAPRSFFGMGVPVFALCVISRLLNVNELFLLPLLLGLFYEESRNAVPQKTTADDEFRCTVLRSLEGDVLTMWKDRKLRSASPNFESIGFTLANTKRSAAEPHAAECTLQKNIHMPQHSDTFFLRLEEDAFSTISFRLDTEDPLAIYNCRGQLEFQDREQYLNAGIPLTTTFGELLDYEGVYQVKSYGSRLVLTKKVNGKKQVQIRTKLPSREELAEVLHEVFYS